MPINAENIDTGNEIFLYLTDEVKGEEFCTGDGSESIFELSGTCADFTETIYLDGIVQTPGVDYTMTYFRDGNSQVAFSSPPGSGAIGTADYAKIFLKEDEALLSEDLKVDPNPSRIETDVHGRDQKLKKSTCFDLKVTLKQLLVDAEVLAKFCGSLQEGPIAGTRKFTYGPAKKFYLIFGRLMRNNTPQRFYYLWGVSGFPTVNLPAGGFFEFESSDLSCDKFEIIEYGEV